MAAPYSSKEHLGGFMLMKTAGQTSSGPAIGTQINIPVMDAPTDDPDNNVYPGLANGSAGSMIVIKGGRTPVCMVTTVAHPSWFYAQNLNDWIAGSNAFLDANYDSSAYSANQYEPVTGSNIYDFAKCQSIVISYNAQGGGIMVQMGWPAVYGPGESGSSPTFTAFTRANGQAYNRGDVTITGFDQDKSFVLTLVRAQGRQFHGQAGLNAVYMTSHAIGGSLGIEQSKTFGSTPFQHRHHPDRPGLFRREVHPATQPRPRVAHVSRQRARQRHSRVLPGRHQRGQYGIICRVSLRDFGGNVVPGAENQSQNRKK